MCVLDQHPHDSDTSVTAENMPALYLKPFEKGQELCTCFNLTSDSLSTAFVKCTIKI